MQDRTAVVVALQPLSRVADAQLVERLQQRQPAAQRELVRRYGGLVSGLIANVLGMRDDVADLSQDTFLVVFRDIKKIRDPDALRSWVASVAVSRARNAIRSRRRRWWLSFWAPDELPESAAEKPRHGAAVAAVYDALEQMPADQRCAFALRYVTGMTVLEVASALGVSHSTAKRRIASARTRFDDLTRDDSRLGEWIDSGDAHE